MHAQGGREGEGGWVWVRLESDLPRMLRDRHLAEDREAGLERK